MDKYFAKNPRFNSWIHVVAGIGIGMFLTYPLVGMHPVEWGTAVFALAVLGHVWAATH